MAPRHLRVWLSGAVVRAGAVLAAVALTTASASTQTRAGNPQGITNDTILLGMSAPFTGASRGLGIELYRGSMAYFAEVNARGGVHGRKVQLRAYDDGYQPDQAVKNTLRLMQEDQVTDRFGIQAG